MLFQQNLQDMWTVSSSVNSVNLVNISATIPEISNFSLARPVVTCHQWNVELNVLRDWQSVQQVMDQRRDWS